jgi:hypothetical protein
MHFPQFSLKTLAGIVAFSAVACCSLIYASDTWSATIFTSAIVFLAFATLAASYSRESARAYWVGCAFCGWLYLLLVFGPLSGTQRVNTMGQLNVDSELATTHLARWLYQSVLPKLRQPPHTVVVTALGLGSDAGLTGTLVPDGGTVMLDLYTGSPVTPAPVVATRSYPDETSFIRVSHALWTWLFALAGGIMGRWLYAKRGSHDDVRHGDAEGAAG